METKEVVIKSLSAVTGREDITPDMAIGTDLVLTSVNAMKLAFDLENELGISDLPQEIFFSVETVQEFIDEIEKLK